MLRSFFSICSNSSRLLAMRTMSSGSYIKNHIPIESDDMLSKVIGESTNKESQTIFLKQVYPYFNETNHITIPSYSYEIAKEKLDKMSSKNDKMNCYYGQGFYPCFPLEHLKQNFLTNPNFYSAYIPYQSEISQGRLELLYQYQTMICNLMNMDISNCSLLDESSACAEGIITLFNHIKKKTYPNIFIDENSFSHHKEVINTRARTLSIPTFELDINENLLIDHDEYMNEFKENDILFFQFQNKYGEINDVENIMKVAHKKGLKTVAVMDPLAATLFEPLGSYGVDVVIGSTQRFGLPMWNGGPHAAFFAAKKEYLRTIPGRIVGKSRDKDNNEAYRLTLQAREQHIKKDKASSNICTSQALLANYNVLYAMYHGPSRLKAQAEYIYCLTEATRSILQELARQDKYSISNTSSFDTIKVRVRNDVDVFYKLCDAKNYLFPIDDKNRIITISLDETKTFRDITKMLCDVFGIVVKEEHIEKAYNTKKFQYNNKNLEYDYLKNREYPLLPQPKFNDYNNEHKITRYITNLQKKDLSLTHSMISLGSCTMKLNSAEVLSGLLDTNWSNVHPFTPLKKQRGYQELINTMKEYLCNITGLDDISFQSNSGATGEYSALCVFHNYFINNGDMNRTICVIPDSAHGTNFASATLAGYKIKKIKSNSDGSLCIEHLDEIIEKYGEKIACMMITFPSTFGFFEENTPTILKKVKDTGAKIYCDGANMNAFLGLINLKEIGVDACHMNLHKTFTIPHGGGGPGLGPIAVTKELSPYLPSNPNIPLQHKYSYGTIASAPFSSASLLTIPYLYITMCGAEGLKQCSVQALLSANYMKQRLEDKYKIPFTNQYGMVSHEFILDINDTKPITEKDICKRLMDYGFHGPTMSWPVASSLMIEPTESEDIDELERFIHSLLEIRKEIEYIQENTDERNESNLLVNAPHSQNMLFDTWNYPYTKEQAYYPLEFIKERKFIIPVSRVDDVYGDRNIIIRDD